MLGLTIGIILEGYTGKGILAQVSDLSVPQVLGFSHVLVFVVCCGPFLGNGSVIQSLLIG